MGGKRFVSQAKMNFRFISFRFSLPLSVLMDQLQSFLEEVVDNRPEQNVECEKRLFSLFLIIDVNYHRQTGGRPIQI